MKLKSAVLAICCVLATTTAKANEYTFRAKRSFAGFQCAALARFAEDYDSAIRLFAEAVVEGRIVLTALNEGSVPDEIRQSEMPALFSWSADVVSVDFQLGEINNAIVGGARTLVLEETPATKIKENASKLFREKNCSIL